MFTADSLGSQPARLTEWHFSALTANLRGQRRDNHEGAGIGGLRRGQNENRTVFFDHSQIGIPHFARSRFSRHQTPPSTQPPACWPKGAALVPCSPQTANHDESRFEPTTCSRHRRESDQASAESSPHAADVGRGLALKVSWLSGS